VVYVGMEIGGNEAFAALLCSCHVLIPCLSCRPNASSGLRKLMPEYIAKKAKFVVLVREPISRALSAYNHYNSNSSKNLTVAKFEEALERDMAKPKVSRDSILGHAAMPVLRWSLASLCLC
jgi:hypothetical protein